MRSFLGIILKFSVIAIFNGCCIANIAGAREVFDDIRFEALDLPDELTDDRVDDLIEGPDGFIWFGTKEGAHRFDGYGVKTYKHDRSNPHSLANSRTWTYHLDEQDRLWMGTDAGVSRYLPETDSFKNYWLPAPQISENEAVRIRKLVRDSENRLCAISESGYIYCYDIELDTFRLLNEESVGVVRSVAIDDQDRLWISCINQVIRYDLSSGSVKQFTHLLDSPNGSERNYCLDIFYESEERIWVATSSNGAVILNGVTGVSELTVQDHLQERFAHKIVRDPSGNMWVCSNHGIVIFPKGQGSEIRYTRTEYGDNLPSSSIHAVLFDSQGNIWVGSRRGGLYVATGSLKFHSLAVLNKVNDKHPISKNDVRSLVFDRKGNLWIGYRGDGVDVFPAGGGPRRSYRHEKGVPGSLSSDSINTIYEDSGGEIWIGMLRGGLQKFQDETGAFITYKHRSDDPHSIGGNDIRGIVEDEKGNLWLNTSNRGVSYFDRSSRRFRSYRHDSDRPNETILHDWARAIYYAGEGKLLIGNKLGLSVLDSKTGLSTNYTYDPEDPTTLSNPVVSSIFRDSMDRIWVGTDRGLNHFNMEEGTFQRYLVAENAIDHGLNSIIEDNRGILWLATASGITRFDPKSSNATHYGISDGLPQGDFNINSVAKDSNGKLYFGHQIGVSVFDPFENMDNRRIPKVHLTDFRVHFKSIEVDLENPENSPLKRSILRAERIELPHDQKVISLEFSALNYVQPQKNQYAYMLEGFDREWNYVGARREAFYTNLNPGAYTFRVKASNNDGYWNEEGRSMTIVIRPPFWGTWWFRGLAIALAIMIPALYLVSRERRSKYQKHLLEAEVEGRTIELKSAERKLKVKNRELQAHQENLEETVKNRTQELEAAKEKAEASDRLKTAFLENMSHEIRTPMNAIIGFIDILGEDISNEEERKEIFAIVKRSGNTLLALIEDILDLSRIESGDTKVRNERTPVVVLCEELHAVFEQVVKDDRADAVQLILEIDGQEVNGSDSSLPQYELLLDPTRLKQILSNLLANAVKFTHQGEIRFGLTFQNDGIVFFVSDTGIGIPENEQSRIFDRFHKVEGKRDVLYRGTGLGLTISKKLAALMGGSISVSSIEGEGSEFKVTFGEATRVRGDSVALEPSPPSSESISLDGLSVLVAEDEPPNFDFISRALSQVGASVLWARNGEEALKLFNEETVDIVLLDIKMPKIDGYDVAAAIRRYDGRIPILAQTAYAMSDDREKSLNAGATDHISKPYTSIQLIAKIQECLSLNSSRQGE